MSIEAAIDKIASKVGAITGVKRAYGASSYDSTVAAMIDDITDTPVALVVLSAGTVKPGNWQRLDYTLDVLLYASRVDVSAAYKALAPFPDRFVTAWKTDLDLGTTVTECNLTGWSKPYPADVNGKPYLVLPFHVRVKEVAGAAYSV